MNRTRLLALALAATVLLGACGRAGSDPNEVGLIYSGGTFEEKDFKGFLEPGSTYESVGMGSTVYRYPTDQRSYIAKGDGTNADTAAVQVVSEDDVRMLVEYQLYFKLNRNERGDEGRSILQDFHENLGFKTKAWTDDGWEEMLRDYFEPQIERSLESAALKHPWRELYASEESRRAFQRDTVTSLEVAVREVVGGDYFCGPSYGGPGTECGDFTFTVGKPSPQNPDIVGAIEAEQTNTARIDAQDAENQRIAKELESERTLVELYGPQGALLREAIRSGKIQFMVVPDGQAVTVPTGAAG